MVHHVTRAGRILLGFGLILAGIAMLVLPGPGLASILLGLALLAPDFAWAQRSLDRMKDAAARGATTTRGWWHRLRTRSSVTDDGRIR